MADKGEDRAGVTLTNLDQELFESAGATKRDLADYLDAVADRMLPVLRDRPLSVTALLRGQDKFMRRNRSTESRVCLVQVVVQWGAPTGPGRRGPT